MEPTCGETGLEEGKHCSDCGEVLRKQEEISSTGEHIYNGTTVCTVCSDERQFTEGLSYALNEDGASYSVMSTGNSKATDILIPSTYEGLPVTEIADMAFYSDSEITIIILPDTLTSIEKKHFIAVGGCGKMGYRL